MPIEFDALSLPAGELRHEQKLAYLIAFMYSARRNSPLCLDLKAWFSIKIS
jgi:hypothetical protein